MLRLVRCILSILWLQVSFSTYCVVGLLRPQRRSRQRIRQQKGTLSGVPFLYAWEFLTALFEDDVYNAVCFGFFCVHKEVSVDIFFDLLELLASGFGEHFVESVTRLDDVLGGDVDVRGLSVGAT